MVDDVMGVAWYREGDSIHYAARGTGPKYKRLYEWLMKESSYRCTGEDWPWDYFVFDNPADHDRLITEFGADVYEDSYKEYNNE
jgi:hypothetical protein